MRLFLDKFKSVIKGVLSGWDRIRLQGTLRYLVNTGGIIDCMSKYGVDRLDQYPSWVKEKSENILKGVRSVIEKSDRPIQYLINPKVSKEALAREIMYRDKIIKGTICGFTAVEPARVCELRFNKGRPFLNYRYGKCLHIYHYLIHPMFGFMHVRLQTWLPFHISICINGREWLRQSLERNHIKYQKIDNCFVEIADFKKAQALMDAQLKINWRETLDPIARLVSPAFNQIFSRTPMDYYWSFQSSELATDVLFHNPSILKEFLGPRFIEQSVKVFSCPDVARFLGKKLTKAGNIHGCIDSEIGTRYIRRPEGTCVKFKSDTNSLKAYIKQDSLLRVETTINDATKFKCPRTVIKNKKKQTIRKRMRKGIADSYQRAKLSQGVNNRFLDALSQNVDLSTPFSTILGQVSKRKTLGNSSFRPLHPFQDQDLTLLKAIAEGKYMLHPFRNNDIRETLFGKAPHSEKDRLRQSRSVTQKLRLLRAHGIIQKIPHSRSYTLTTLGHQLITTVIATNSAKTEQILKLAA